MNPISNSLASSGLLNTIETVQGMLPNNFVLGLYVILDIIGPSRKNPQKDSESRGRLQWRTIRPPSPMQVDSEPEIERSAKRRRSKRKASAYI